MCLRADEALCLVRDRDLAPSEPRVAERVAAGLMMPAGRSAPYTPDNPNRRTARLRNGTKASAALRLPSAAG